MLRSERMKSGDDERRPSKRLSRSLSSLVVHLDIGGTWIAKIKVLKDHAKIGDLTLALAGRWRTLRTGAGRGG